MRRVVQFFLFLIPFNVFGMPANVVIIRHAEKPSSGHVLSPQGERRAQLLVNYFKTASDMVSIGLPDFIFASNPKDKDSSLRSIQTVTPLAKSIKLPINSNFVADDFKNMVSEILTNPVYNGKNILVAWGHKKIDKIAKKLGVTNYPDVWPDDDFESVWIINYKDNAVSSFSIVKQGLDVD